MRGSKTLRRVVSPLAYAFAFMTIVGLIIPLGGPPLLADHCAPPVEEESGGGMSVRGAGVGSATRPAPSDLAWPPAASEEPSPDATDATADADVPATEPATASDGAAVDDGDGAAEPHDADAAPGSVQPTEEAAEEPAAEPSAEPADDPATEASSEPTVEAASDADPVQQPDGEQASDSEAGAAADPAPAGPDGEAEPDDELEISGRTEAITLAQSVEDCPTLTAPGWVRRVRSFTVDAAGFRPPDTTRPEAVTGTIGGNPRGAPGESSCAGGHVTGVRAAVIFPHWADEGGIIGRIAAVCGEVAGSFIGTATDPAKDQSSTCPSGQVVVGLEGREGDLVDGVLVRCQGLDASGRPTGEITRGAYAGGMGGGPIPGPLDCPSGMAATGLHGLEDDILTSVGLACTGVADVPSDIVVEICRDGRCDWWGGPYTVISAKEQAAGLVDGQVDIEVPYFDSRLKQITPFGTYQLRATAADGSVATTDIELVEPEAHVSLVSALDLAAEEVRPAGIVRVVGAHFDAGVDVEVVVECALRDYWSVSETVTADDSGRVEVRLRLPADVPPEADCWTEINALDESSFAVADDTFWVRQPNPAVKVEPVPAVEGETFVVSGTDFAPETDVKIAFVVCDVCDDVPPVTTAVDRDGSFATAALDVPGGAPALRVDATTEHGDSVSMVIPVESLPPVLIVPEKARAGGQLKVGGASFPSVMGRGRLSEIDLALDCGDAVIRPRPGRTYNKKVPLASRQFTDAILDVPETDAATCQVMATVPLVISPSERVLEAVGDATGDSGASRLRAASVESPDTMVLASAPLTVTQGNPVLVIDPPTVAPRDPVTVSGVDFVPGELVTLTYQWPAEPMSADVVADAAGGFTHTTTAPAGSVGAVPVTAVGDRGSDVSSAVGVKTPQAVGERPPPVLPPSPPVSPPATPSPPAPITPPTTIPTLAPTIVATTPAPPPTTPPTVLPTRPPVLPSEPVIVDPKEPVVPTPPINPPPSDRPLVPPLPPVDDVVDDGGGTDESVTTTDESSDAPSEEDVAPVTPGGTEPADDTPAPDDDDDVAQDAATQDEETAATGRVRSRFTQAVPLPSATLLNGRLLGQSALVAAFVILFMLFSGELFNATYEEHAEEINGWFGPITAAGQRLAAAFSGPAARTGGMVVFLGVTGVIGSLLDPEFGFDRASIALLLGITAGLVVITAVYYLSYSFYMRRTYGEPVRVQAVPGAILVALACVAISRAMNFEPGYLYGVIAGIALQRELSVREEGKVVAITALGLLVASVASWLAWGPVVAAASAPNPGLGVLVLDATLASVFVAGVEILAFSLLPMRFLDGPKLKAFNPVVWLGFLGLGMFGFVHVLLHPDTGMQGQGSLGVVVALFVGFGVFSAAFWAYFRFRKPRPQPI